jgi:hypothetical protein
MIDFGPLFAVKGKCYICLVPIHEQRMERDHFPIPERDGGTLVLDICLSCHDLKDRIGLAQWDVSMAVEGLAGLWTKAAAPERLILAKMFHVISMGLATLEGRIGERNLLSKRAQAKNRKTRTPTPTD